MGTAFIKEPFGLNRETQELAGNAALPDIEITKSYTKLSIITAPLSANRTVKLDPVSADLDVNARLEVLAKATAGGNTTLTFTDGFEADLAAITVTTEKTNRIMFQFNGSEFELVSNTQLD